MSRIDFASLKRTLYYLRRNGLKNTCYTVRERLEERKQPAYRFMGTAPEELHRQRRECAEFMNGKVVCFSVVVPCYRTGEKYLRELMDSLRRQTYPHWELILADATEDHSVEKVVSGETDERIRYLKLAKNAGIAENTNRGIEIAEGEYVGLLDHDDLLTEDALYEMRRAIENGESMGEKPALLYSDEDKCSSDATEFFELNNKEDFNLDLFLSNNYICHFMVMERKLIQTLLLRGEYDGAQDYDLALRAVSQLECRKEKIVHVPKVLYHWRCHAASTAENPQSKLYAYRAGRRAVQDFVNRQEWRARVVDTSHLGFYRLEYPVSIFDARKDIGAVGGPLFYRARKCIPFRIRRTAAFIVRKSLFGRMRILSGRLGEDGTVYYAGLPKGYSGPLHRASVPQDADAVDIRNIRVREELWELFSQVAGVPWKTVPGGEIFDVSTLPQGTDLKALSLALGKAVRSAGYRILYLPEYAETVVGKGRKR